MTKIDLWVHLISQQQIGDFFKVDSDISMGPLMFLTFNLHLAK